MIRKTTTAVLVLAVLLALCGSTIMAKRASASLAKTVSIAPGTSHAYFKLRSFSGMVPNSSGGLSAAQLRKAYGIDQLANQGQGITIAIVEAYGNPDAQNDLNMYDTTYGLPATTITVVYPQGKPTGVNQTWALETDVDLQMAHMMAPKARLVLEVAKSSGNANLFGAVRDAYTNQGATIVSMSFGSSEFAGETSLDSVFSDGINAGVSFIASSGDSGTGTQYPAASPFVTAVGGTTLHVQSDGTYISETAWSGSGGGVSAYESHPTFQGSFNRRTGRGIPDVAMIADPNPGVSIYDSFGYQGKKGFFSVGGTSTAAALFAGVLALANELRGSGFKNANVEIYNVASSHYAADFHDITSGSNGTCGFICTARPGYDYVTGLGSPVANRLVPDL